MGGAELQPMTKIPRQMAIGMERPTLQASSFRLVEMILGYDTTARDQRRMTIPAISSPR
jgi:hypothetical protein